MDHITPVTSRDDPQFWHAANHQPLCHECHSIKTNTTDRGRGHRRASCTLVCGPLGSGRGQYIHARADHATDLIVAADPAKVSIVHYAVVALSAMFHALAADTSRPRSWIRLTAPRRDSREALARYLDAELVVLATPVADCMQRLRRELAGNSPRLADAQRHVEAWWAAYEPPSPPGAPPPTTTPPRGGHFSSDLFA